MYHGIPTNYDFYVIVFGVIAWIIRGIVRAARRVSRRGSSAPPVAAPLAQTQSPAPAPPLRSVAPLQAQSFQAQPSPSQAPPRLSSQTFPARTPRLDAPRLRQPAAGGPAVSKDATRTEMERQEQALFFSEPAALNTPLTSAALPAAASVRSLLGGPDDLIRAIILQEVLGPPLSRRAAGSRPAPKPQSPAPPQ